MGSFDGKTVLVTGAARGIGQAIALAFAEEGANMAVADVQAEWLDETVAAVEAKGRRAARFAVDVRNAAAVQAAVDGAVQALGGLDVLVNNAGITRDTLILRMSEADWDDVIAVNLRGTFLFTKAAAKIMLKKRSGSIVNIASIIGMIGNAGQANYAASKAGVIALTKSSAKELAARGIRVNAVAPGFIRTKMTDALPEDVRQKMLANVPLGCFGTPENVARVVLFLAGENSAYVTGEVINISGGMVM